MSSRTGGPALTTVFFQDQGDRYAVMFSYNADLVDLMKTVPKQFRWWDPDTKKWHIASWYALILAKAIRERGHPVVGLDEPDPPPRRTGHGPNWAQQLFSTVGVDRADQVHRALTRILHPDNQETGDHTLQRQLNDARADLQSGGTRQKGSNR